MKVKDIEYKRCTLEEITEAYERYANVLKNAESLEELLAERARFNAEVIKATTYIALGGMRYTLDTTDEFYTAEQEYYDSIMPTISSQLTTLAALTLQSKFLPQLKEKLNPIIFEQLECAKKAMSPEVIAECEQENAITMEYTKLMAGMLFDWKGEKIPLTVLRGELENSDREVRRAAATAIGEGLQAHKAELDDIYDRLVAIRTTIARKMGYRDYVELGYYRMGRIDYNRDMVEKFRENVVQSLVPVVSKIKSDIAAKLGFEQFMFYDDTTYGAEAPRPCLDVDGIFAAAREMYDDMSPEIGAFMHYMCDNEAFDVLSRPNKTGGGYCTEFPLFNQPFILANFNGTSADIDVMTHEFGHALASSKQVEINDYEMSLTMEVAECHSMSMEFLAWKYMDKFFGAAADDYRYKHVLDSLSFIPYGCIVDEFQHIVYSRPEMTPAERDEAYLALEKKYRPYLHFEGIPYLELGTRWQYQAHIFESPFYYIDYCLAQTVALGFLAMSKDNYAKALAAYQTFVGHGGSRKFSALVNEAGLYSPFGDGSLSVLAEKVLKIVETLK